MGAISMARRDGVGSGVPRRPGRYAGHKCGQGPKAKEGVGRGGHRTRPVVCCLTLVCWPSPPARFRDLSTDLTPLPDTTSWVRVRGALLWRHQAGSKGSGLESVREDQSDAMRDSGAHMRARNLVYERSNTCSCPIQAFDMLVGCCRCRVDGTRQPTDAHELVHVELPGACAPQAVQR